MFDSTDYVEKFEKEFSNILELSTLFSKLYIFCKIFIICKFKEFAGLKDDDKVLVPVNGWSSNINAVIQNKIKTCLCRCYNSKSMYC